MRASQRPHLKVRRGEASRHVGLMLVAFAATVLGVRIYLFLTGYPQVGGGTLHISHALWGGLLLFVATLLPLLFVNRWAFRWSALLSGAGVGLFIDEVGKLITQDSDYFFPAAAPIVYAVFLLSVLVFLRSRRERHDDDGRRDVVRALDALEDALAGDLDAARRRRLERGLDRLVRRVEQPDLHHLAVALLTAVRSDTLRAVEAKPSWVTRQLRRLNELASRWLREHRLRVALVVGLAALGLLAMSDLVVIVAVGIDLADGSQGDVARTLNEFARIQVTTTAQVALLVARVSLDLVAGALLLLAAVLLVRGNRARALALARAALLLALTVINLLVFYFEQFVAAASALLQFSLLQAVAWYRRRFLPEE